MKYCSARSSFGLVRRTQRVWLVSVGTGALVGCATYDGTQTRMTDPVAQGGAGGTDESAAGAPLSTAGLSQGGYAGTSGAKNVGGFDAGEAGRGGSNAGEAGEAETAGVGGENAGAASGGRAGAGAGGGGTGGGGTGGGGTGGGAPAGAGGAPADELLSQGKTATADSTQTGNVATLGNDGSIVTRWCAANSDLNHYWQVDLGVLRTLGRIDIAWEKAANYKFKVEGSSDNTAWALLIDQQATTSSASGQSYKLATSPKARWVKITVTGLPNTTTWASFYEFQVFGH